MNEDGLNRCKRILTGEILASLGAFLARNPNFLLTALRCAAATTLITLCPRHEPILIDDAETLHSPQVVLLEAAEIAQLRWARSAGKSEEIVRCAASMVLELWEFADQRRRSPGKCAGELIHESGWANAATAKILRKLELGSAVAGVVERSTAGEPARQTTAG